jgi:hypothetical protein
MPKKKQYNKKVEINYVGDLTDILYNERVNNLGTSSVDNIIAVLSKYQTLQTDEVSYIVDFEYPEYYEHGDRYKVVLHKHTIETDEEYNTRIKEERKHQRKQINEQKQKDEAERRKLYEQLKKEFGDNGI